MDLYIHRGEKIFQNS